MDWCLSIVQSISELLSRLQSMFQTIVHSIVGKYYVKLYKAACKDNTAAIGDTEAKVKAQPIREVLNYLFVSCQATTLVISVSDEYFLAGCPVGCPVVCRNLQSCLCLCDPL